MTLRCNKHTYYAYCPDCGERFSIPNGYVLVAEADVKLLNMFYGIRDDITAVLARHIYGDHGPTPNRESLSVCTQAATDLLQRFTVLSK